MQSEHENNNTAIIDSESYYWMWNRWPHTTIYRLCPSYNSTVWFGILVLKFLLWDEFRSTNQHLVFDSTRMRSTDLITQVRQIICSDHFRKYSLLNNDETQKEWAFTRQKSSNHRCHQNQKSRKYVCARTMHTCGSSVGISKVFPKKNVVIAIPLVWVNARA